MKAKVILSLVIVVIILFVLAFVPIGIRPLTEVSFDNRATLPSNISLDKTYNYAFTIHNLEYQRMRYYYSVNAYDESNSLLYNMDNGEVILVDNETKIVYENFSIDNTFGKVNIVVNVTKDLSLETPSFKKKIWFPDPNYPTSIDINFWVEESTNPLTIIKTSAEVVH